MCSPIAHVFFSPLSAFIFLLHPQSILLPTPSSRADDFRLYRQVCRNGKCAAELENIIPDYTHVTQVVSQAQPTGERLLARSDQSLYTPAPPLAQGLSNKPQRLSPQSQRFRSRNFARSMTDEVPPNQRVPPGALVPGPFKKPCRDIIEKMAGSLSCSDFLDRFGYRYCNHNYVKRNCCASHANMCNKPEVL